MSQIFISYTPGDLVRNELERLFTQPFLAGERVDRLGEVIGVTVRPQYRAGQAVVDLSVSVFPLHLAPPTGDEIQADKAALTAFLENLQDADPFVRAPACGALAQLGDPSVRQALETVAAQDESRPVRAAATRALAALDAPRLCAEDLAGLPLLLWQQHQHLWTPGNPQQTDRRGQLRFVGVPADAVCGLQPLSGPDKKTVPEIRTPAVQPDGALEWAASSIMGAQKYDASAQTNTSSLPQSVDLKLEEGGLLCTLRRNAQQQLVLEFRSDAPQLEGGQIYLTATNLNTEAQVLSRFVALQPDRKGVQSQRLVLSEMLNLEDKYALRFLPVPRPKWKTKDRDLS